MKTQVEGITYLLAQEEGRGLEYVTRYSAGDMEEVFTAEQREQLAAGEAVVKHFRGGSVRYVDMVFAARLIHAAG